MRWVKGEEEDDDGTEEDCDESFVTQPMMGVADELPEEEQFQVLIQIRG